MPKGTAVDSRNLLITEYSIRARITTKIALCLACPVMVKWAALLKGRVLEEGRTEGDYLMQTPSTRPQRCSVRHMGRCHAVGCGVSCVQPC
jgi:hypothetical protein